MDSKQFKDTFSVVQASDALRLEVLQMTEKTARTPRRLLPKVLLAAVIISLLTSTAVAANVIWNTLKDGKTEYQSSGWYAPSGSPYEEGPYDTHEIYIDVVINPDAPTTVEMYYLPVVNEDYSPYLGSKLNGAAQFGWLKELGNQIRFSQYAGGNFDTEKPVTTVFTPAGETPQTKLVEMDGISGYLIEDTLYHGQQRFYWSNGDYVFLLIVPDEYTDAQLEAMVKSVHYVPSIEPYLVPDEIYEDIVYGNQD